MPQHSNDVVTYILYAVIIVVTIVILKIPKKK